MGSHNLFQDRFVPCGICSDCRISDLILGFKMIPCTLGEKNSFPGMLPDLSHFGCLVIPLQGHRAIEHGCRVALFAQSRLGDVDKETRKADDLDIPRIIRCHRIN